MEIEKFISYQIEKQFPSLFREEGRELVELVKFYYKFLEETPNQSLYNNRRIFEYRDIDNTLGSMILYFKNKYMKDLPLNDDNTRFIVKNILDLYRRKGTPEGVELFFRMFYDETISVYYPAEAILKPSSSAWVEGVFLQMYPTDPSVLNDLTGRTVFGSATKAEAVVDRIIFVLINNTLIPILYLSSVRGTFVGFDDIYSIVNNELVNFGKVYGSLSTIDVIANDARATTGNRIGDILNVVYSGARGGKAIVSNVSQNITGEIVYTIEDPGFGYTKDNTHFYVSNQILFSDNLINELSPLEYVEDQYGNRGMIVGGNEFIVGIRMDPGEEFSANSIITTSRTSNNNIVIVNALEDPFVSSYPVRYFSDIVIKNDTSPGPLFPETANNEILSVKLNELDNVETVSLITDIIGNYLDVQLDSLNYNDAPALIPMSGLTDPVTSNTAIDVAFDLTPFEIGSIKKFINVKPGVNYINKVFAIAHDPVMSNFDVYNQNITLQSISTTFEIGKNITQGSVTGKIVGINGNTITVLPYAYYGFKKLPITYNGLSYNVVSISRDYTSNKIGFNASISTVTEFAVGRILNVEVLNSGYGYSDQEEVLLTNDAGQIITVGNANSRGQGIVEGRWSSKESHLNFQDGKVLQDSDFYQEFSYLISSKIDINSYKDTLTDIAHLAGTKMFGEFSLKDNINVSSNIRSTIIRDS